MTTSSLHSSEGPDEGYDQEKPQPVNAPVPFDETLCPVCEGAGWDWKRCADEDLLVDDPVDEYWCSACQGKGRVLPS